MDQDSRSYLDTGFVVGTPRQPLSRRRRRRLSAALADLEAVREAHLPELLDIGAGTEARLVLVVVVEPPAMTAEVLETVRARLPAALGRGERLEVRALATDHPLLPSVREADCVIGWRD